VCFCLFVIIVGRLLSLRIRTRAALLKRSAYDPAENNLKQHGRGRAHRARLGQISVAESSVFVRGFPVTASRKDLENFFQDRFKGCQDVWRSNTVSCVGGTDRGRTSRYIQENRSSELLVKHAREKYIKCS